LFINQNFSFNEDALDLFKVLFVHLKEDDVFLLKFILDDWSTEKSIKGVEEFEFSWDGIIVVESLGNDGSKSSFEFFDFVSEFTEIIVELGFVNIHDVVFDHSELFDSCFKFVENLGNGFTEGFSFGSSEFFSFKFVELDDGIGKM